MGLRVDLPDLICALTPKTGGDRTLTLFFIITPFTVSFLAFSSAFYLVREYDCTWAENPLYSFYSVIFSIF